MIPSETHEREQRASEGSTELAVILNKHSSMYTLGFLNGDEINDARLGYFDITYVTD